MYRLSDQCVDRAAANIQIICIPQRVRGYFANLVNILQVAHVDHMETGIGREVYKVTRSGYCIGIRILNNREPDFQELRGYGYR